MTKKTRDAQQTFLQTFGLAHPVIQGPMGGVAGPRLVSAVANAGALGMLPIWLLSPTAAARSIAETQALTDNPFAVNLRADLVQHEHIKVALDAGVNWLHLFWGDPKESVRSLDTGSHQVLATVGDAEAARAALEAGANALIAQGVEAGGHVLSEQPLQQLLDSVLGVAGAVPVIAAGGCANAADAQRLVSQGAAGVLLGTRFVASTECDAHPAFKTAIVDAGAGATTRSLCFDDGWSDAPHRTLTNQTVARWLEANSPPAGSRPGEAETVLNTAKGASVARYSVTPPTADMNGDIGESALYCGTGAERVEAVCSVADIVAEVSSGALLAAV